jgi:hypothetical protein
MKMKVGMLSLLSMVCLSPASFGAVQTDAEVLVQVGDVAPSFSGETLDNKRINLSDYSGQVLVLDFFATW